MRNVILQQQLLTLKIHIVMIKTEESTRTEDQSTVSDRGILDQTFLM